MLDWMFLILLILAVFFVIMAIYLDDRSEPFWKILSIVLATIIFFVLALSNLNIETAYPSYNSTTGVTTMKYDQYISESSTYLTYFFGLMGVLCIIYSIVLLFDIYFMRIDEKE
jgi:multidrug transporter EmrE-like cation transporter